MKAVLNHIFSLGVKEIIGLFRDPLLLFLIVYAFTLGIYIAATAQPDAIDRAAIAIVDEDNSPLTKRLTDAFLPPMFLKPERISRADIDRTMDEGRYTFVLVFPPALQERLLARHRAAIQLNVDATRMSQAFAGNGYIQDILGREARNFVAQTSGGVERDEAELMIRNRFNPNLTKTWDGAVGELANNIAMIALILTGAALIRERERGTLEHLLVTPVNPVEIILAKIWSMSLVVLVATAGSLILVIQWMLGIPMAGSIWLFLFGVVINLFVMTSLGIFLACFARDMPQLGILLILVLMPMQILSGGGTPIASMPPPIQLIMKLAPTTYLVKLSKAVIFRGAEFQLIWQIFVQMLLLGAGYFLIALLRFRKSVAS